MGQKRKFEVVNLKRKKWVNDEELKRRVSEQMLKATTYRKPPKLTKPELRAMCDKAVKDFHK